MAVFVSLFKCMHVAWFMALSKQAGRKLNVVCNFNAFICNVSYTAIPVSLFAILNDPLIQRWRENKTRKKMENAQTKWIDVDYAIMTSKCTASKEDISQNSSHSNALKSINEKDKNSFCCNNTDDDSYHICRLCQCLIPFINQCFTFISHFTVCMCHTVSYAHHLCVIFTLCIHSTHTVFYTHDIVHFMHE